MVDQKQRRMIFSLAESTSIKGITNQMFHEHFPFSLTDFFLSITFIQRLDDVNPKKGSTPIFTQHWT